ncbi:hypothetical protein [Myroides odoratimimus]|uniref:hypothetical protein n=1 Tax=Myroides odoratimimus TaxID=76832 RepID=UPI00046A8B2C|nr:hypothetical protein [Myroides odoratimimus]
MKKAELNYNQHLSGKGEWIRYFAEYDSAVKILFENIRGGEITIVSLPLAFLIRHTLEIGYKANLIELEKVSGRKAKIEYKGKSAHKIDNLHKEFEDQMHSIIKKHDFSKEDCKRFSELNDKLIKLKRTLHKLDELSYSFRYPVENDGITLNFKDEDVLNFKNIKELYDESIVLLKYSTDVVNTYLK